MESAPINPNHDLYNKDEDALDEALDSALEEETDAFFRDEMELDAHPLG